MTGVQADGQSNLKGLLHAYKWWSRSIVSLATTLKSESYHYIVGEQPLGAALFRQFCQVSNLLEAVLPGERPPWAAPLIQFCQLSNLLLDGHDGSLGSYTSNESQNFLFNGSYLPPLSVCLVCTKTITTNFSAPRSPTSTTMTFLTPLKTMKQNWRKIG